MNLQQITQIQAANLQRMRTNQSQPDTDPNSVSGALEETTKRLHRQAQVAMQNRLTEVRRICNMPIEPELTPEEVDTISRYYCPDGSIQLWPKQAMALAQYHQYGGVFIPLSVGGGKTLISALICSDAFSIYGKRKIVLICPTNLVHQFREKELPKYRRHISINVPFFYLSTMDKHRRMLKAKSNQAGVYVMTYSLLSSSTGGHVLDAIQPELIVGDEIHKVTAIKATGRSRRFREVLEKYKPQLVGLSGTITKKRPTEYYLLVSHALKQNSFLPLSMAQTVEWSKMIDCDAASAEDTFQRQTEKAGPLGPLIKWAKSNFPTDMFESNLVGFRKALRKRIKTCPGVVASSEQDLGVSLTIKNHKISINEMESSQGWTQLQEYIQQLVDLWIAPNGDEIEYGIHLWKWRYELDGFGFYNNLYWPSIEKVMGRRNLSHSEAESLILKSKEYHAKQQSYHKLLRLWIQYQGRQGLDTPALVGLDMSRNGAIHTGKDLYQAWDDWKSADFPNRIERDSAVVRVCDFRVNKVLEWAVKFKEASDTKHEGALIWYKHQGVGSWIMEKLLEAGLPAIHCPSGSKYNEIIEDDKYADHFVVSSIGAHNAGHNLQHFGHMLYAQWPREASLVEQSIGRIHRNGQKRDEVFVHSIICSEFDRVLFAACLNDSAYIHQSMSTRQKLIYANYEEPPKVLPYAVLKEWGSQPTAQNREVQQFLSEQFGE